MLGRVGVTALISVDGDVDGDDDGHFAGAAQAPVAKEARIIFVDEKCMAVGSNYGVVDDVFVCGE